MRGVMKRGVRDFGVLNGALADPLPAGWSPIVNSGDLDIDGEWYCEGGHDTMGGVGATEVGSLGVMGADQTSSDSAIKF